MAHRVSCIIRQCHIFWPIAYELVVILRRLRTRLTLLSLAAYCCEIYNFYNSIRTKCTNCMRIKKRQKRFSLVVDCTQRWHCSIIHVIRVLFGKFCFYANVSKGYIRFYRFFSVITKEHRSMCMPLEILKVEVSLPRTMDHCTVKIVLRSERAR